MWVNPEINASDAFVAAFLPGSEGGGIADVLFRRPDGAVNFDFKGKLSYSWPKRADQTPLNRGDAHYDPLFAYGFGLTYSNAGDLPRLSEERPAGVGMPEGVFFSRGAMPQGWSWKLEGTPGGTIRAVDRRAQEDARAFTWPGTGEATASIAAVPPVDISREATGELSLVVEYRVDERPSDTVTVWMACGDHCGGTVPIAGLLRAAPPGEWRTLTVPLRCFVRAGLDPKQVRTPFAVTTDGRLRLSVSDVRIASAAVPQDVCGG
jgi:beta-glucosidase